MTVLRRVLTALATGEDGEQVRAVLGDDPGRAAAQLDAFVRAHAGSGVAGCGYAYVSAGVALELRLEDGREVVLKASRAAREPERIAATGIVQRELARLGFPAPAVLALPRRCAGADVGLMEARPRGQPPIYDEAIAEAMATTYARLVALAQTLEPPPDVPDRGLDPRRLWPTPHSVIFDFEATAASAGDIDALAERARRALLCAPRPTVITHCDWALQNLAFVGAEIVAVFDWDSVGRMGELEAVAGAAAFHQQDWRGGPEAFSHDFYPGPDTALAFADTYARARGRPWSATERRLLHAALVLRLAYQARCEHALDPTTRGPAVDRLFGFVRELDP